MALFLDTEFTDFINCELISIALVSEDGEHEFYAERTDFDLALCNDFVRAAVLPRLGTESTQRGGRLSSEALTMALRAWLAELHALKSPPEDGGVLLVLYDYQTDLDLFADALDGEVPPWVQGHNVARHLGWVGLNAGANAHHALHDARALRVAWLERQSSAVK